MTLNLRWWICSVALVTLLAASVVRVHGQLGTWALRFNAPEQLVQLPDGRGRLRLWRYQANAHIYADGSARGGALLERGGESYELTYRSATYVLNEDGVVETVTFVGEGVNTTGNRDKGFGFVEMATRDAAPQDPPMVHTFVHVIHDIDASTEIRFEAEGSITTR
jgi:hypothetical protein